ncbi:MAG TPA: hypothetical protein PKD54_10485, partial [Pirellulaceae bacterium]|nr:hypothetical protein [Pirellulaceae bacterium]
AKCPGFTTRQVETTYRSLKDIRDWFDAHPEVHSRRIEVCWRLAADMAERLDVLNSANDWTGRELAAQLRHCDALITTPSTTMLEGMALRKPVALLDYHLAPQYSPAAWTISAREHIADIMGELMAPHAVKMGYQQYLFRDALYQGEPATDRLERLIRQMAEMAHQCAVAGQALRFAPQLLGPPSPVEESWDFCTFFPQIAEISTFGVSESQREWGHARREIECLNARIAQLQSELGEAHRIFESIHRHPVAGPIVRLRQKWLDWLQRLSVARTPTTKASPEAKT